jgi:peptide alpha-N-acetyltransferase
MVTQPQITLRLARRTDVPSMQRCNLASLPENYNQQFFTNHMRQWPELTIVAECNNLKDLEDRGYSPFPSNPDSNIVAYVLGKVEDRTVRVEPGATAWDPQYPYEQYNMNSYITERVGHVTSLAVLHEFRRQGLARELMNQLHYHLESCYGVDSVGLHVRQSNKPATHLYQRFGYVAAERIPGYYQDGEDAFFMKKQLGRSPLYQQQSQQRLFGGFRKSKPWEIGPDSVQLPRFVGQPVGQSRNGPEASPELLTGSM